MDQYQGLVLWNGNSIDVENLRDQRTEFDQWGTVPAK